MADSKPSDLKICVTCQYWGGRRKASTFRESVEYGSDLNKSECVGGGRDGQQPTRRAYRLRILTAIASVAVGTVNNRQHGADVINGKSGVY
jgi:hypothetical protein